MTVSLMATEGRPPHVVFEERSVEDRAASDKAGHSVYQSVDYVVIRQVGDKYTSIEKEALPWIESLSNNANYAPQWVDSFRQMYKQWKDGQEVTPMGVHIKSWARISKAQADTLIASGILTVEDLAAANEQTLLRVGMGARELQYMAREWLEKAKTIEKTEAQTAMIQAKYDEIQRQHLEQTKKNEELAAQVKKLLEAAEIKAMIVPESIKDDFLD